MPFYETIESQIETHGWRFLYENKSGFLDLPMPMDMIREIRDTGILDVEVVVKMVFPLLIAAGIFLTLFLWSHLVYIRGGWTTLERMASLKFMRDQSLGKLRHEQAVVGQVMKVVNPFDQGEHRKNVAQIMGTDMLMGLLPVKVKPAAPYLPEKRVKSD